VVLCFGIESPQNFCPLLSPDYQTYYFIGEIPQCLQEKRKKKGLVAVCHSLRLFIFLYNRYSTFIQHSFINIRSGPSVCFHSCWLSGRNLNGVPSRDSNSGLSYSKPAYYQLSQAAFLCCTWGIYIYCTLNIDRPL
jgi:hypothetical protein